MLEDLCIEYPKRHRLPLGSETYFAEKDGEYVLTINMCGITPENLLVEVGNGALSIEGVGSTPFCRRIFATPSDLNEDATVAQLDLGVLVVRGPKIQKKRRILVEGGKK